MFLCSVAISFSTESRTLLWGDASDAIINGAEEDLALDSLLHPPPTGQEMAASPTTTNPPPSANDETDVQDDADQRGSGGKLVKRQNNALEEGSTIMESHFSVS